MQERAKAVAERLRALILERGWNQSELARRSGMRPSNISNYLRGSNVPNPRQLAKLAEALGTTPADILNANGTAASNGGRALCLTHIGEQHGQMRLQIDQVVPADVATQVIGLLLPRMTQEKSEICDAPAHVAEAANAEEASPLARVRGRSFFDALLPANPPKVVNAKQVRPLDSPCPADETQKARKVG